MRKPAQGFPMSTLTEAHVEQTALRRAGLGRLPGGSRDGHPSA